MALEILQPGALSTVQDLGRRGYQSQGFQESGACDKYSMRLSNLLAGNLEGECRAAVVEFTLRGGEIRFTSPEVFSLAGADMEPFLNGTPVPMYEPVCAEEGDVLTLSLAKEGLRTYLAVYGGVDVPLVMGSRSTNLKCRLGGFHGRVLKQGDILPTGKSAEEVRALWQSIQGNGKGSAPNAEQPLLQRSSTPKRYYGTEEYVLLRAVEGPQIQAFTEEGVRTFLRNPYRLSSDCDRMACRLEGPVIDMIQGADIISDGIVEGSVQVSASGLPMVMMSDHQTTGGYAKIATVISTDIPALAQLRPGEWVTFQFVTPQEAVNICRREEQRLVAACKRFLPVADK
ncbi:5-oxoprolinase subunit C family protein [Lacrimispora aerotolerans]|uniref:5-oxoprolinase subunit C family protein n=1 Tax=Lacrimispora aerotolerans TaxID=36832 RepID=UPI000690EFA5|nr:biotin-dependent carboxyltransferase family protein [Lacrimispora aerotolerans]